MRINGNLNLNVIGNEAGGHGYSKALPLLTLLPIILAAVYSDRPLVLAAGGLATGAQVAAVLALGASGAVLGTRFLLTPESFYTDAQKRALADADSSSTVRTMSFDYARNTLGWPDGVDGRGLRNCSSRVRTKTPRIILTSNSGTVDEFEGGGAFKVIRQKFEKGVREDDPRRMLVWAGTGVGLMTEIKSAKVRSIYSREDCKLEL